MGAKVSVIIPVYGVEKYIERCARSLFEQTLDDIEYLFIDDCTPDKSIDVLKRVLEEYPQRKPQVTIHRMERNSGQAKVREWGMRNATGDYLIHCDSDDWIASDMYKKLYDKASMCGADVVVCDYFLSDGFVYKIKKGCLSEERKQMIKDMCTMRSSWALWNKLVRAGLYHDDKLIYPKDNMGEDMALTMQLILKTEKIAYIHEPLYYYYYNPQSITNNTSEESIVKKYLNLLHNSEIVIKSFSEKGLDKMFKKELNYLKWNVRSILWEITYKKEYRRMWVETYRELFPSLIFSPYLKKMAKLKFLLTYIGLYPQKR